MEENRIEPVPYLVHEAILTRQERNIKRLFILCVVMFAALVGSNLAWIIYEAQFEEVVIEQEADTDNFSPVNITGINGG